MKIYNELQNEEKLWQITQGGKFSTNYETNCRDLSNEKNLQRITKRGEVAGNYETGNIYYQASFIS